MIHYVRAPLEEINSMWLGKFTKKNTNNDSKIILLTIQFF